MDNRNIGRIKKYGICVHKECEDFQIVKEIIHGDMECPKCHKKLSPCPPPKKKKNNIPLFGGIVLVGIAVIAGSVFFFSGNDKSEKIITEIPQDESSLLVDTNELTVLKDTLMKVEHQEIVEEVSEQQEQAAEEPQQEVVTEQKAKPEIPVVDGKYQLSYGYYTGDIKDGYPHGQGRLTYTVERQINKYDMKKRTAKVGQYVIGEFQRGFFIQGRLYAADGELLESIMIGTAPGDTYEKL